MIDDFKGVEVCTIPPNGIPSECDRITPDKLAIKEFQGEFVLPPIGLADRSQPLPLSYAQQRLWFIDQLDTGSVQDSTAGAIRLHGKFQESCFRKAVETIITRHEVLRTNVITVDGEAQQLIQEKFTVPVEETDLSALGADERQSTVAGLLEKESRKAFDLSADLMLRIKLLRLSAEEHLIIYSMHPIASDGWSKGVLIREFSELYNAYCRGEDNPLVPLRVQYADYACWQREWLRGEVLEKQLGYWREQLEGIPVLHSLPVDKPRPAHQSFAAASVQQRFDPQLTEQLRELCQCQHVTLFMLMQSAFAVLLSRYSNEKDIVMGIPTAGRIHQDIEKSIGSFLNILVVRSDVSRPLTFEEFLEQNRRTVAEGFEHRHIPFALLVEELIPQCSLAYSPIFQILFALQNNESTELQLEGLKLEECGRDGSTLKVDLEVYVTDGESGLSVSWVYNKDLFLEETVNRFSSSFEMLLRSIVANPKEQVGRLELLTELEHHRLLVEWNDTATDYPRDKCIHDLFEEQAKLHPDAMAVVFEEEHLTYNELNERANQLAHYLIEQGVRPDSVVGLCVERSLELVVGLLGVLKAGGAYVPLDPDYPQARLEYMLKDSEAELVLSQSHLWADLSAMAVPMRQTVCLDEGEFVSTLEDFDSHNPDRQRLGLAPSHLAYVIYTSGSTGQPKGAMVPHRALVNRIVWMQRSYPLDRSDVVLQKTPYSFDVSVWELTWPFIAGASLVMARPGGHRDPSYLVEKIQGRGVTTLHFVPSMFRAMVAHPGWAACRSVRRVFCSGEALEPDLVSSHYGVSEADLHNLYGPTEAAIDVTFWPCPREGVEKVLLGRPIQNIRLYVVNESQELQPVGVVGELLIGGEGVGRGYLNQGGLTSERFITDPYSENPQARLYRTGDLVRWQADGNLEFLGRLDHQVKVRGYRIELGEIESALLEKTGIQEAVVVVHEWGGSDKRLVAYVVVAEAFEDVAWELRGYLQRVLPDYMVPSEYVELEALPLTMNGKLDRRGLPWPGSSTPEKIVAHSSETSDEEKLTKTEIKMREIWEEALGKKNIDMETDIILIGGHSLTIMQILKQIHERFGLALTQSQVYGKMTIKELSLLVDTLSS